MNTFKLYLYTFFSAVGLAIMGYIKYLRASNANKETEINTLNNNFNEQKEVFKDEVERAKFEVKQATKAEELSDEIKIDKLDEERGDVKSGNNFTAISV